MQLLFSEPTSIFADKHIVISFKYFQEHFFPALQQFVESKKQLYTQENKNEKAHESAFKRFLQQAFYPKKYVGNKPYSKGEADLVITESADIQANSLLLCEVKSPLDKTDMISATDFNKKSLHQAITYFLLEVIEKKNFNLKHILITDTEQFYLFDATDFHRLFYETTLRKNFENWHKKTQSSTSITDFYAQVANFLHLESIEILPCIFFHIDEFMERCNLQKKITSFHELTFEEFSQKGEYTELKFLYKIFSPEYFLKSLVIEDSNSLNEPFYLELLHILGVEEIFEGGKSIIRRKLKDRNIGSFLEMTLLLVQAQNVAYNVDETVYGHSREEQQFSIALELALTWVNRVLFLKLLEGQLLTYHYDDTQYHFLTPKILPNFSEVYILFHKVLALKPEEREADLQAKYHIIPYLNSSLFEISELEHQFAAINALGNGKILEVFGNTVLQNSKQKMTTLEYFLHFLNAFDFSSVGKKQEVEQEGKPLINAAVLGKIFEKINGYKDGSVFTSAYVTMYMCRQAIRKAVIQKFNEKKAWNCVSFEELNDKITDKIEANAIINSIKICDPAVGSGHFLVSALNEIIAIKSELQVLVDIHGKRVKNYKVTVVNDELEIRDVFDNELFVYRKSKVMNEMQVLQETLFHEKQIIIENCLFGVDINPNSVKICCLRLWIELLKNAYYQKESVEENTLQGAKNFVKSEKISNNLQTLPNIDINIKIGNSLISRFSVDTDLKQVLRKVKYSVKEYRNLVRNYKDVRNSAEKYKIKQAITEIKNGFRTEIAKFSDPRILRLQRIEAELFLRETDDLFNTGADKKQGNGEGNGVERDKIKVLQAEKEILAAELQAVKSNIAYARAFEWRFEFPEILDDEGEFLGFDLVIANPPYGLDILSKEQNSWLRTKYTDLQFKIDTYSVFLLFAKEIAKKEGIVYYVIPSTFMDNFFEEKIRLNLLKTTKILEVAELDDKVFAKTVVHVMVIGYLNIMPNQNYDIKISASKIIPTDFVEVPLQYILQQPQTAFSLRNYEQRSFIEKLNINTKKLFDVLDIRQAIKTGNDSKFIGHTKEATNFKKVIGGRHIQKWKINDAKLFVNYGKHLACPRDSKIFEQPKLLIRETGKTIIATYDKDNFYVLSSLYNAIRKDENFSLKYLLALINSKLFQYLMNLIALEKTKGAFTKARIFHYYQLPIKNISTDLQKPFVKLVDKILKAKTEDKETQNLENQLDNLVYQLYELTEKEILMVEKSGK
jgi:adenine-specific DNA-methyltransferase